MARSLRRVRQHRLHLPLVAVMHLGGAAQMALSLGALLREDVAHERLRALDAAAGADGKALRGAALGFHLGHDDYLPSHRTPGDPRLRGDTSKAAAVTFARLWRGAPARYARAGFAAILTAAGLAGLSCCFGFSA